MEAHDGLSAKIAQRAGFKGLWASSFALSTALGLPDNDSMSAAEMTNCLATISRSTRLPVLADGNCGFGSLEREEEFIASLVELGIGGVCFEDKQYPKANTFFAPHHPLMSEDRYCEILDVARGMTRESELFIVARSDGLVRSRDVKETIRRCETYRQTGAEALFVSWVNADVRPLSEFVEEWAGRTPLIINPTAYTRSLPVLLASPGISVVIWANQNIRACCRAMTLVCQRLQEFDVDVCDQQLSSMNEIFDLIGYDSGEK